MKKQEEQCDKGALLAIDKVPGVPLRHAKAFLDGRGYVVPQDVKDAAAPLLRHRIGLSYEAEAEDRSADDIVNALLEHVPVP